MAIMNEAVVRYNGGFPRALGRNGSMRCTGLAIDYDDEVMRIRPINTRGVGVCYIELPITDLGNVINTLKSCKESLKKIGVDCGGNNEEGR